MRDVDEAFAMIPHPSDEGRPLNDFPIVVVSNGIDHFVGTISTQPTFTQGIDQLCSLLQQARLVAHNLEDSCEDGKLFVDIAQGLTEYSDNCQKLVKPSQESDEEDDTEPLSKKPRKDATVTKKRETFTLTKKHCHCGQFFQSTKEKKVHIKQAHTGNKWKCTYVEGCSESYENGKSLKRHIKCDHLKEFNHNCWFCDYGRDQEALVLSHMVTDHQQEKKFPCTKEICAFSPRKVFPTGKHRDQHEKYCGVSKQFECSYCGKKFARMNNKNYHEQWKHLHSAKGWECQECGKHYKSKASYKYHYTIGNCYSLVMEQNEEEDDKENKATGVADDDDDDDTEEET